MDIANKRGMATSTTACAPCKHQRKKCNEDCILAPYFPSYKIQEFQAVHKVFGVSNVIKLVKIVKEDQRQSVVDSLIWEALCRQVDPILGPFGEYKKIEEELKLYRGDQVQNQMMNKNIKQQNQPSQGELVQRHEIPRSTIAWNNNGVDIIGVANDEINCFNDTNCNIIDSISFNYPLQYVQGPIKHDKNVVAHHILQQQHLINGFHQQLTGQFGSINSNSMESAL